MYCRYCGNNIPDGSVYCPNCGKKQTGILTAKYDSCFFSILRANNNVIILYLVWLLIHIGLFLSSNPEAHSLPQKKYHSGFVGGNFVGGGFDQHNVVHKDYSNGFYPFDESLSDVFMGKPFWFHPLENIDVYDSSELFVYTILLPFLAWCLFKAWPSIKSTFCKCCIASKRSIQKLINASFRRNHVPVVDLSGSNTSKKKWHLTSKQATLLKIAIAVVCLICIIAKNIGENSNNENEIQTTSINGKQGVIKTGWEPYSQYYGHNMGSYSTLHSGVEVTAPETSDVIVIIRKCNENGDIAGHVYICAGDTHKINLLNGTYQTFFYYGEGWNSNKDMGNGVLGGFLYNEVFSKDSPQKIHNSVLYYILQLQRNGNIKTKNSSRNEIFK